VHLSKRELFTSLGYTPHAGQVLVHRSKASRRVLACGVRWGKTRAAAMEGLAAAMEPREHSRGWVVAPTYDLGEKVFRELVVVSAEHLRHRIVTLREHDKRLVIRNLAGGLSEVRCRSADNPTSLLGEGLDWLICDEFAQLKPAVWQNFLTQRLIDRRGWALLISTPRGKGLFYDLFRRGQGGDPDFESWNHPSWSNPHLSRELIEKERARLPERVFRQEFCGEFIEGAGQVFRNVRELATRDWAGYDQNRSYCAGLDLAQTVDYTVLVIMDELRRVVHVERFQRLDWAIQIGRIKVALERYGNPPCLVDATGAGKPIHEQLLAEEINAVPYIFTNASKAALISALAIAIERREIGLPRVDLWPDGIEELEAFQYSITDAGNVKTGAPSGQHDDCVTALSLANWEVANRPIFADEAIEEWA